MSRTVHVVQGDLAAELLREALPPRGEEVVAYPRTLGWPPPAPGARLAAWADAWAAHAARSTWLAHVEDAAESYRGDLERLLWRLGQLRPEDRVVAWVGPAVDEHLALIHLAHLLEVAGAPLGRLHPRLVGGGAEPAGAAHSLATLGEVALAGLARTAPPPPLDAPGRELLARAYAALTAPDPRPLRALLGPREGALPFVRDRLRLLRRRFPAAATGLTPWEVRLLGALEGERQAARAMGLALGDVRDPELLALYPAAQDEWFLDRLLRLGGEGLAHPLVRLSERPGSSHLLLRLDAELTDEGRAALAGERSALAHRELARWVAGIPVDAGRDPVWCWEGGDLVPRTFG